jgi:hypothetical protein
VYGAEANCARCCDRGELSNELAPLVSECTSDGAVVPNEPVDALEMALGRRGVRREAAAMNDGDWNWRR